MAKILVTGATGAVGRFVARSLLAEGHTLRLLLRSPNTPFSNTRVTVHQADLGQPHTLKGACEGMDIVIHLAAMLHVNNPSAELHHQYRQVNVVGTQRLVEDALRHQVRRFVFASTISVYGSSNGRPAFTEHAPLQANSIYAETKIKSEHYVRNKIDHVILRLAAVYGQQMNGNYPRMVRAIGKRRFAYVGDGHNRRAIIHERDVAAGFSHAIHAADALNQTFNLTDGQEHTLREISEAIAAAQNVKPPSIHLPVKPLRLALGFAETAFNTIRVKTPLSPMLVDKMMEDVAVSNQKFQTLCGFTPQVNLTQGWVDACQTSA
ncbi:MAG: NAD-dependent epimerase/dehydratase family protein [Candidatus Promineifilaceae bacterium]